MAARSTKGGRPLKVYWAEIDGLNTWVVAAPNRPEVLAAFGVRQNLFAQGEAGEVSEPSALAAARETPLTPLRRPKGSSGPFEPATGGTDWSAAIPKSPLANAGARPRAKTQDEPPPKPDRTALDRAEARLDEIETRHREAVERIKDDRERLKQRQALEEADYAQDAAEARKALKAAERAFRDAGGDR